MARVYKGRPIKILAIRGSDDFPGWLKAMIAALEERG
jgi:hypothetical protein